MSFFRCNTMQQTNKANVDYFVGTDYPTGTGEKTFSFGKTFKQVPECYVSSTFGPIKIKNVTTSGVSYTYSASGTLAVKILAYVKQ